MPPKKHKTNNLPIQNHKTLVFWAADCAEHVFALFEKKYPKDKRPCKAIETARDWAHKYLPMKMKVIRTASLSAHAAARKAKDASAQAAARAAGQAVASVHVPGHALAAAIYAVKAAGSNKEREWQFQRLPKNLWQYLKKNYKKAASIYYQEKSRY